MNTTPVTPADEVMDIHVRLRDSLRDQRMVAWLNDFMQTVADAAKAEGGGREVANAFSSLFWPANTPEKLAGLLRKELFTARTYQVTANMVDAVNGTYLNSAGTVGHLEEEELPSESGFVWLDRPHMQAGGSDLRMRATRAVSWSPQSFPSREGDLRVRDGIVPGLRLTAWYDPDDYETSGESLMRRGADTAKAAGSRLLLSHTQVLPFGSRFGGRDDAGDLMYVDDFAHWLHVLWIFMATEITVTREAPLSRPARRRAERGLALQSQNVNVIMLRRAVSAGLDDGAPDRHRQVDWSCQWPVQGHHRHLARPAGNSHHAVVAGKDRAHCAICDGKVTWVKPYLKGPDGLPLRSADQLYRLSR